MKRSAWVRSAVLMQFLLGLVLSGLCIFLFWLMHSSAAARAEEAGAVSAGLKVAVDILAPPALVVLIGAYGLWKLKLWGWWLALLSDMTLLGVFIYSAIDDGRNAIDWDVAVLTAIPLIALIVLLARPVRELYWGSVASKLPVPPSQRFSA